MASPAERAIILREEGNVLYKELKLLKAIKKYQEAAKLTPDDASSLGNLSAAYLEVRKYTQCITRAEKALDILNASPDPLTTLIDKFKKESQIDA